MIYLFDIDGTLTPPCQKIDPHFNDYFLEWSKSRKVVLITGSDSPKSIAQLGINTWNKFIVYQCSGNQIYAYGILVYEEPILYDEALVNVLKTELDNCSFPYRCGRHIEHRHGMINFSIVGRDCTLEQRHEFFTWDENTKTRQALCVKLQSLFPDYDIHIGGQISVDIYRKGKSKGQVVNYLSVNDEVIFIGDKTKPGGNDYAISSLLPNSHVYTVKSWRDTMDVINQLK